MPYLMTSTTEIELKKLIQDFQKNPKNLDLINQIAIGYLENTSIQTDDQELKYFELAYSIKKTVKSTHNLAWFLYFEHGEEEKATEIQNECIQLNPSSFYPYYQYGFFHLEQSKFSEAILFLKKAYQIEKRWDILHNIGYCYFQLKQFQKSKEYFSKCISSFDVENKSLYNLGVNEWNLKNFDQVKIIADKLTEDIEPNAFKSISGYDIGFLYFLIDDLESATKCLIKQGINGVDLIDCKDLSYSLFITDKKLWKRTISESINERKKWCAEIENNHEDWSEYDIDEKKEYLNELKDEIKIRQNTIEKGIIKPLVNPDENVWFEHCGCLLYDCLQHGNSKND